MDRGQTLELRGCLLLLKVNRAAKSQERILLVTARALYTLKPGSWAQTNRVPLAALSGLSMSTFADGFVVVSVNAAECDRDADLVLSSPQKAELVTVLKDAVSRLGRPEPLAISFADTLEFRSGKARGPIDSRGPPPDSRSPARPLVLSREGSSREGPSVAPSTFTRTRRSAPRRGRQCSTRTAPACGSCGSCRFASRQRWPPTRRSSSPPPPD